MRVVVVSLAPPLELYLRRVALPLFHTLELLVADFTFLGVLRARALRRVWWSASTCDSSVAHRGSSFWLAAGLAWQGRGGGLARLPAHACSSAQVACCPPGGRGGM